MTVFIGLNPENLPDHNPNQDPRFLNLAAQLLVLFGVSLESIAEEERQETLTLFLKSIMCLTAAELLALMIPSVLEKLLAPLGLKSSMDGLKIKDDFSKENIKNIKKILAELDKIIQENHAALGQIGDRAIEENLKFNLAAQREEENLKFNPLDLLKGSVLQKFALAQGLIHAVGQIKKLLIDLQEKMAQAGSTVILTLRSGTSVRLKSAIVVDRSDPKIDRVVLGFEAPREDQKEERREFADLSMQDKKEAACLATTHLFNQMAESGLRAPGLKRRSVNIHAKTLDQLAQVAAHDARMHALHQVFASSVSHGSPYISVRDVELQLVLALMSGIRPEFTLPVSELSGLYGPGLCGTLLSGMPGISILSGPTPGVR